VAAAYRVKEVFLTSARIQLVRRIIIYGSCFEQHVLEANNKMPIPLSKEELNLVMVPLTAYLHPFCNSTEPNRPICLTIGAVLNQLINRRIITTDFFL